MFGIQSWLEMENEVVTVKLLIKGGLDPFTYVWSKKRIIIHTSEASLLPL